MPTRSTITTTIEEALRTVECDLALLADLFQPARQGDELTLSTDSRSALGVLYERHASALRAVRHHLPAHALNQRIDKGERLRD